MTFSIGAKSGSFEVLVEDRKEGTWFPGYCILAGTTGYPWGKNRACGAMQRGPARAASRLEFQNRLLSPVFQKHFQGSYVLSLKLESIPEGDPRPRNIMPLVLWARACTLEALPR